MKIAMLGHKRIPSREGGVEIVVSELSTRMVKLGNDVTVYNRGGKHVSNKSEVQDLKDYQGVKIKKVLTIDAKGLAAVTSSFFATMKILCSKYDVVHYHAEGPCAWMWILKWFSRKRIMTLFQAIHTVIIILYILKYKNILAKSFVFQNNFVSLQPT